MIIQAQLGWIMKEINQIVNLKKAKFPKIKKIN